MPTSGIRLRGRLLGDFLLLKVRKGLHFTGKQITGASRLSSYVRNLVCRVVYVTLDYGEGGTYGTVFPLEEAALS